MLVRCGARAIAAQSNTARQLDANGSFKNICLADDNTIRSSVGASLMWNSPVGPLRMDFAKVLSKEAYDEEQIFRFGASTKF